MRKLVTLLLFALWATPLSAAQISMEIGSNVFWGPENGVGTGNAYNIDTNFTELYDGLALKVNTADLTTVSTFVDSMMGAADLPAWLALTGQDDIQTALGIAASAVNFGTFTGSTLTDSSTLKALLQELETAVEGLSVGGLSQVASGYPSDGACNYNTTDRKVYCTTGNTVYSSVAMTLAATLGYTLSGTITDTPATGSTFTIDSVAYDSTDSPISISGLNSATQSIVFAANDDELGNCTGTGLTGTSDTGPWAVDMSSADVDDLACTVSAAATTCTTSNHSALIAFSTAGTSGWGITPALDVGQTYVYSGGAYTSTGVSLWVADISQVGDLTVSLYAVDASHHPTGTALASVTMNHTEIGDTYYEQFFEWSSYPTLVSGTEYAVVGNSADVGATFNVKRDSVSGAADGSFIYSDGTWAANSVQSVQGEGLFGCVN